MGWTFIPNIIRYQWLLWKKKYDWGYGSWTDWSIKINSKTDNSAVTEEANVDKAITAEAKDSNKMEIYLKEERKTQAYQETMNIDIENIKTFEKRNKVYTAQWRAIYEVIEPYFLDKPDTSRWFFYNLRIM